jgi:citrate lyase subunit beta/citryl-CoA lyase
VTAALARSYLFIPGHAEPRLATAFDWGADAGEGWREDLPAVVGPGLYGIRVPKVRSREALQELEDALLVCERQAGMPAGGVRLTCSIESAAGLFAVPAIAALPRVAFLAFGAADFAADIGCGVGDESAISLWAQAFLVASARAAGAAPPIAPPYLRVRDREGLLRTSQRARDLGFFGRSLLHPSQIATIHAVFSPGGEEVAWAREVIQRYEEAVAAGSGGTLTAAGEFVGPPIVLRARRLLELARTFPPAEEES